MERIDLAGSWKFRAIDAYRKLPRTMRRAKSWMKATVPGTAHTDLMENGLIPDPHVGMNELQVQWVEAQKWLYRREFFVTRRFLRHRAIDLVAAGLDTYARLRINGEPIGEASNMFVEHRFPVRRRLREGKNAIEILLDSPVARSKKLEKMYGKLEVELESYRAYARKAQYSFGWDWGPKLTTSGIWRDIFLQGYSVARVEHLFVKTTSLTHREALLRIDIGLKRLKTIPLTLVVLVEGHGARFSRSVRVRSDQMSFRIRIPDPEIWWPNGYGDHPLYTVKASVCHEGHEVDSALAHVGIRTVRLVQEKDVQGRSLVLEINGKRVFCKGANWIPADSFLPRVRPKAYEKLLTMARDAHMNMLRVWGGGIYEQDIFYKLCDRLGIMVWQDFMFACGEYPQNRWFLKQVQEEATRVVTRLRNHPSIVLWCGNNECEWVFCAKDGARKPDDMSGALIFRDILPGTCQKLDGTRPYWRSSPFGKGFPNDESSGNHHQWSVWSGWKDYPAYLNNKARFVTEFGFQGPADMTTFRKVMNPSDRAPQSPVMEHHNKQIDGVARVFRFLAAHHRVPSNFEEFIYKGQILQAEALKTGVEHWRRRKFKTAGSIIWQLNDCWPATSWSLIDSALRPKAAYYYARRFFSPVLVSISERRKGRIEVWVTNDTALDLRGTLSLSLISFRGGSVWKAKTVVAVGANSSRLCHPVDRVTLPTVDPACHYLHASFELAGNRIAENRLYFVEPKHLMLSPPLLTWDVRRVGPGRFTLQVKSKRFAKDVYVTTKRGDIEPDDNFFDLDPGALREIPVRTSLSAAQLSEGLVIRWVR